MLVEQPGLQPRFVTKTVRPVVPQCSVIAGKNSSISHFIQYVRCVSKIPDSQIIFFHRDAGI